VPGNIEQIARNTAGALLFENDDALKKIKVLSGGEKSRVLLGKILVKPANLLLLDEPTNHFDMESSDSLLSALDNFPGACMIVTHNQMFLHAIPNRLLVFDAGKIFMFEGTYEEFLEKIGWESEKNEAFDDERKTAVNQNTNKKEVRKKRAEIIEEKSKAIKPIETKYKHLEKQIEKLESELKIYNEEFLKASVTSDGEKIAKLSKTIHDIENNISNLYNEFEDVMNKYDEKIIFFEKKLSLIEE
jgi:ATP-binding cassette, subfamily F, member 3